MERRRAPEYQMTGPEMAALVKIGTRLVRGEDWKWADQVRVTGVKGCLETSLGNRLVLPERVGPLRWTTGQYH